MLVRSALFSLSRSSAARPTVSRPRASAARDTTATRAPPLRLPHARQQLGREFCCSPLPPSSSSSSSSSSGVVIAAVAAAAAVGYMVLSDDALAAEKLDAAKEVVGQYENRLREMSSPEKVFEYFASVKRDGAYLMTPADFVRSITPYDYRDETVVGEGSRANMSNMKDRLPVPEVFSLIDLDGDGLINFGEYMFFTTLLAIPESHFEIAFKLFDENGDGVVDADEFKRVMYVMRNATPAGRAQRSSPQLVGNAGLSPIFFGNPIGSKKLTFKEFHSFMVKLHEGLLKMEFDLLDTNRAGWISARDFAMHLCSFGNMRNLPTYRARVEQLRNDTTHITYKQFRDFNLVLKNVDKIDLAIRLFISSGQPFTPGDLQRATKAVAGVDLDKDTTRLIFHVYDKDGDGRLDWEEFSGALKGRASRGTTRHRDLGVMRFFECCKHCFHSELNPRGQRIQQT